MTQKNGLFEWLIKALFFLFIGGTLVVMVAIAGIGLFELILGLFYYWNTNGDASAALPLVLSGLEFMLLSPLPFLAVWSVSRYVSVLIPGVVNGAGEAKLQDLRHQREGDLHRVKTLFVSLMAAIVATDLIKDILKSGDLDLESTGSKVLVLLALLIFQAILWWTSAKRV